MMTTLRSIHLCFFLQILMLKRQTLSEGHQLFEVNDTEGRNQIFLYSQHCYFAHILAMLYYQRDPYTRSTETNSLKKEYVSCLFGCASKSSTFLLCHRALLTWQQVMTQPMKLSGGATRKLSSLSLPAAHFVVNILIAGII